MLAYMIAKKLCEGRAGFDLTIQDGIKEHSTLCAVEIKVRGQSCPKISDS
jgi:hypothetical protein